MLEKDKIILEDAMLNTADALFSLIPGINIAWMLSKARYWSALKLRQNRLNEFVEYIQNNLGLFTQDILNTEEFQDWFVIMLEAYLKERNEDKRIIMQKIFLWFGTSDDIKNFELERMINTVNIIWSQWLKLLSKISIELMPYHIEYIKREIMPLNNEYSDDQQLINLLVRRFPWIWEMFKQADKLNEWEDDESQAVFELQAVWMVNSSHSGSIWGGATNYDLTNYGFDFIEFIK